MFRFSVHSNVHMLANRLDFLKFEYKPIQGVETFKHLHKLNQNGNYRVNLQGILILERIGTIHGEECHMTFRGGVQRS